MAQRKCIAALLVVITFSNQDGPVGGTGYTYSGKISGHSVAYSLSAKALGIALGTPVDTVLDVFDINSSL